MLLPSHDRLSCIVLQEGKCFIEGDEPHAFGMIGDGPFVAALAVVNLTGEYKPICEMDGKYRTSMLEIVHVGEILLEYK